MTRLLCIVLLALILVYGLTVRLFDLTADPPAYFVGGAQDLTTDGPYLTIYARNAVEHGQWNPLGYEPWRQFKISLISAIAYVLYSSLGVTRFAANLTGVILSAIGLALFLWGLSRHLSRQALLAAAALLAASFPLTMYSRIPLAENGLIFLCGVIYFVYSRWFDGIWGKIAVGGLVAAAALVGKSFGFLLVAAPLAYLLHAERRRVVIQGGAMLGATVVTALAFSAIFYRGSNLLAFLIEHGAGEHGNPYGFSSPVGYLETVISFSRIGLHRFDPVTSVLAYTFLVMLLLSPHLRHREQDKVTAFMIGWLIIWIIGLAPFNYRPVRYMLPMILPMAVLGALWLEGGPDARQGKPARLPWWRILALLVLNWYATFALANAFISHSMLADVVRAEVWYSLPVAAVLTFIILLVAHRQPFVLPQGYRLRVLAAVVLLAVFSQWSQIWPWWSARTHTIDDANRDLAVVVGSSAVVAGQYGPAVTEANGLQGFPLFVSSEPSDAWAILKQYPVTHLAMGYSDWQSLIARTPSMQQAPVVARYWMRDNIVYIVRIAGMFGAASTRPYALGEYERVLGDIERGDKAAALVGLQRLLVEHPEAKSPQIEFYHRAATPENLQNLQGLVDSLVRRHGSDFTVQLLGAVYYKYLARLGSNQTYVQTAERLRDRAIALSPDNRSLVENGFRDYTPSDRIIR